MEKVGADRVVTIHYALYEQSGELVEDTSEAGPFSYVHGRGGILPALENALEGMSKGDTVQITVACDDAYGEVDPEQYVEVPVSDFPEGTKLEAGIEVTANSVMGPSVFKLLEVGEETVKVDQNHPLAGMNLDFFVEVIDVREGSPEELENGIMPPPEM